MDGSAIKAMMAELAPVIRDYIDEKLAPVVARVDGIEDGKCDKLLAVNASLAAKAAQETAEQLLAAFRERQFEPDDIDQRLAAAIEKHWEARLAA